jgi:hypothetical protein
MDVLGWLIGLIVVAVFGSAILFTWALCRSSALRDDDYTTLDYKRELEVRFPPSFAMPAAKGFRKRDETIGQDQVSRAERGKWIA